MYHDMKKLNGVSNMKDEHRPLMLAILTCAKVKPNIKGHHDLWYNPKIPKWQCATTSLWICHEASLDRLKAIDHNMEIVGRGLTKEAQILDPELISRDLLRKSSRSSKDASRNRDLQKSYADLKRKPMEFQVGDKVMLKVCLEMGVDAVLDKRGEVNTYCHADEPLAVSLDGLHLDDKLHFVEEPLEIVGREVKRLKQSRIPLVKVRWNSKRGPEFTWEREDQSEEDIHKFV
ncbi:hypothetical protein Tco_0573723 [Tanacetum coccineum]